MTSMAQWCDTIDSLDELSHAEVAAFAIDRTDRIIFWNRGCENLVGRRAKEVIGKPCFEVMCGRDAHGNIHCYSHCPIMYQSRMTSQDPVRDFPLSIRTGDGVSQLVTMHTFVLPASRPAQSTIVHVMERRESNGGAAKTADSPTPATEGRAGAGARVPTADELTQREREVLRCLAEGLPTPSIAEALGISPVTVRNHVQKILEKLDVHTKFAAVAYAYQNGLV
ncbi:MAG TPA: LuxR C-terminal-related transcriptional regulator [Thermoanaerobaculia bacterium]|nr:LuxR C-terminal-related transcriptional regulator [Thermoanaerobaculia bacterium]